MGTQKIQKSGLTINTDICNSPDYDQGSITTPKIQREDVSYKETEKWNKCSHNNFEDVPKNILKIYFRNINYKDIIFSYIIFLVGVSFAYNNFGTFISNCLIILTVLSIPFSYFNYLNRGLKKYIPPPIKCYTMFESNNYLICKNLIIKHLNEKYDSKIYIKKSKSQKHTLSIIYDTGIPDERISIVLTFSYVSDSIKNRYIIMFRRLSGDVILYNAIYRDIIKYLQINSNCITIN